MEAVAESERARKNRQGLKDEFQRLVEEFHDIENERELIAEQTEVLRGKRLELGESEYNEQWQRLHERNLVLLKAAKSIVKVAQKIHEESEKLLRRGEDCLRTLCDLQQGDRTEEH